MGYGTDLWGEKKFENSHILKNKKILLYEKSLNFYIIYVSLFHLSKIALVPTNLLKIYGTGMAQKTIIQNGRDDLEVDIAR